MNYLFFPSFDICKPIKNTPIKLIPTDSPNNSPLKNSPNELVSLPVKKKYKLNIINFLKLLTLFLFYLYSLNIPHFQITIFYYNITNTTIFQPFLTCLYAFDAVLSDIFNFSCTSFLVNIKKI